jgi:hypothetical protein
VSQILRAVHLSHKRVGRKKQTVGKNKRLLARISKKWRMKTGGPLIDGLDERSRHPRGGLARAAEA